MENVYWVEMLPEGNNFLLLVFKVVTVLYILQILYFCIALLLVNTPVVKI